jgi:hypothetical protein
MQAREQVAILSMGEMIKKQKKGAGEGDDDAPRHMTYMAALFGTTSQPDRAATASSSRRWLTVGRLGVRRNSQINPNPLHGYRLQLLRLSYSWMRATENGKQRNAAIDQFTTGFRFASAGHEPDSFRKQAAEVV